MRDLASSSASSSSSPEFPPRRGRRVADAEGTDAGHAARRRPWGEYLGGGHLALPRAARRGPCVPAASTLSRAPVGACEGGTPSPPGPLLRVEFAKYPWVTRFVPCEGGRPALHRAQKGAAVERSSALSRHQSAVVQTVRLDRPLRWNAPCGAMEGGTPSSPERSASLRTGLVRRLPKRRQGASPPRARAVRGPVRQPPNRLHLNPTDNPPTTCAASFRSGRLGIALRRRRKSAGRCPQP